jgi:DNA-binding transcriptional LysR family regulator
MSINIHDFNVQAGSSPPLDGRFFLSDVAAPTCQGVNMRLEQLEYLAAVVQHGSLRRASEHLHISQPALSEGVGKLERELGVTLLDRHRSGARINRSGRELLAHMTEVLEAVDRLRAAAGDQNGVTRTVRVGTVNTGTSSVVAPAVLAFQRGRRSTTVEVVDLTHPGVVDGVLEGSLDLGLVNLLSGDELPAELEATVLVRGVPVVVVPPDHPWASQESVTVDELREERFVAMRPGYVMHRFAQRLFGGRPPATTYRTDGSGMGKLLVADRMGVTVLPDYSVVDDPLSRAGLLVHRPLADDRTEITLALVQRRAQRVPESVRELRHALVRRGQAYRERVPARSGS